MTDTPDTPDTGDITVKVDPPPKAPRGRKAPAATPAATPAARRPKGDPAAIRAALDAVQALLDGPRRSEDERAAVLEAAGVSVGPGSNTYQAKGHGIVATGTAGPHGALSNWCNAARRRLLAEGGAA